MLSITDLNPSHEDLVDSFEVETRLWINVGPSYEGDCLILLQDKENYGCLIFGYGSCGGCDELEGSYGNLEELTTLRNRYWDSIEWKSRAEMCEYFLSDDAQLQWWGHAAEFKSFKAQVLEVLKN